MKRINYFDMVALSLVIVRNPSTRKFLSIRETRDRGWWIPGGKVDPPEDIKLAAVRECKEEGGIDVELKGILKIIYDTQGKHLNYLKMKFVFYGEPVDAQQRPKAHADRHSEEARWVSLDEFALLEKIRGKELLEYGSYLEAGGVVHPLDIMQNLHIVEP